MIPITHVVIFQYKTGTTREQKEEIANAFIALREGCLAPELPDFASPGTPYILSIIGGSNNSSEAAAKGYEHAYVVIFASAEHRDYYVDTDPIHIAFKEKVGPLLEKVVVTDFANEVWD